MQISGALAVLLMDVGDRVTHDKYGLGTVTSVEEGTALLIDFGSHVQRILTPSAKLSKL